MYIKLKTLFPRNGSRQECKLTVENSTKVSEVKQMASRILSIPANKQKLLLAGVPMNDNRTLEEYSVLNGQLIHVVLMRERTGQSPGREGSEGSAVAGMSASARSVSEQASEFNSVPGPSVNASQIGSSDASSSGQTSKNSSLRNAMRDFFRKYYSESDTEKVLDVFMNKFEQAVSSWSLDDLERMSAEFLKEQGESSD